MSQPEVIACRNIRTHNLKGIDVDLPIGKWIALTGVSGSGKSSLAFDSIYSECQRRFLETLGTYERQFLAGLPQGDFDSIEPVPPAIALKQTHRNSDPRSVIATSSDIIYPLRTLFSSLMNESCSACGSSVVRHSQEDFYGHKARTNQDLVLAVKLAMPSLSEGVSKKKVADQFSQWISGLSVEGYSRVVLGTTITRLEHLQYDRVFQEAALFLVLDVIGKEESVEDIASRLSSTWETLRNSDRFGTLFAIACNNELTTVDTTMLATFRVKPWCQNCSKETKLVDAGDLDWQSTLGSCKTCAGLGNTPVIDEEKVIPDDRLSLKEGAIKPFTTDTYAWMQTELLASCKALKIPIDFPYADLPKAAKELIWKGEWNGTTQNPRSKRGITKDFVSLENFFTWLEQEKYKQASRILLARYRKYRSCPECKGARIGAAGRFANALSCSYDDVFNGEMRATKSWLEQAGAEIRKRGFVGLYEVHREVFEKVSLLCELGLGSSALSRRSKSLSGGEYQRVLLSRVLGNGLTDALYVLDEPSIGLGAHEIPALISAIQKLRDQGNTVLMVEHDPQLIRAADVWIELGPEGGNKGGYLLTDSELKSINLGIDQSTPPRRSFVPADQKCFADSEAIRLHGFSHLNCENLFVEIPLGQLTVIGGPSGAGKSTLIKAGLDKALHDALEEGVFQCASPDLDEGRGMWSLLHLPSSVRAGAQLVSVEQRAGYRSIASVPATLLGIFDHLRKVFSTTEEAKERGLNASDFSFNGSGACTTCAGRGFVKDDLFFLGEVEKECETCAGLRYRSEVLEVKYKGRNISEWLNSSIEECLSAQLFGAGFEFSAGSEKHGSAAQAQRALVLCCELGIGHLPLGIPSSQISGGEAQRLRIAASLIQKDAKLICLIDEPSRGLSEFDIGRLLTTFQKLCKMGHTIVVVEHHAAFQLLADQLILMGPGAGTEGGKVCKRSLIQKREKKGGA